MPVFTVYFIDGLKTLCARELNAVNHNNAYKKYIEVEGIRNYPVRTINQEDQSDWQWKDHQQDLQKDLQNHRDEEHRKRSEERKQQEKIFIEETTDALKECLIKKLSFVVLPDDLRGASEKLWNSVLGKQLNQWSEEEKSFYLLYSNFPGRKDYLNELAENKKTHINEIMIKKMDAALQLLVNIADSQSANNKKIGKMADGAKMSSIISAIALQHEMSED